MSVSKKGMSAHQLWRMLALVPTERLGSWRCVSARVWPRLKSSPLGGEGKIVEAIHVRRRQGKENKHANKRNWPQARHRGKQPFTRLSSAADALDPIMLQM